MRILVLDLIFFSVIVLQSLIIAWCRLLLSVNICLNLAKLRCRLHTVKLVLPVLVNHLTLVHPERLVQKLAKDSIAGHLINFLDASIVILLYGISLFRFDFGQIVLLHFTCSKDWILLGRREDALSLDSVQHRPSPTVNRIVLLGMALRWILLFLSIADDFNGFVPCRGLKLGYLSGFLWLLLEFDRWLSVFDSEVQGRRDVKRVQLSIYLFLQSSVKNLGWLICIVIGAKQVVFHFSVPQFHVEDVCATHDLQKCVLGRVLQEFNSVDTVLSTLNQDMELGGELLEEVNRAVLSPQSFEGLKLQHKLPVCIKNLTFSFNQGSSVILVSSIQDWTRLVINTGHFESLMDLLSQVFVTDLVWPILRHLDCLVGARISHLEEVFFHITVTHLFSLDISRLFERLMTNFTRGDLAWLGYEFFKIHV